MSNAPVTPAEHLWGNFQFVTGQCLADITIPFVCLLVIIMLTLPKSRGALGDPWTLAAFLAIPLLWIGELALGVAFVDAMDGHHDSPPWAIGTMTIAFWIWPAVAIALIVRGKNARIPFAIYTLCNVPLWLLTSFVAGMAVSGDWI